MGSSCRKRRHRNRSASDEEERRYKRKRHDKDRKRQHSNSKEETVKRIKLMDAKTIVKKRNRKYLDDEIKGLQVDHDVNTFEEGKTVILTLEDKEVLDDSEVVFANINMLEDEQTKKNNENKKKIPIYFNHYDDEDLTSELQDKPLLEKYDEETKQKGYKIGMAIPEPKLTHLATVTDKLLHNLNTSSNPKIASDYYNEQELAKFKKPKKRVRKLRANPNMFSEKTEEKTKIVDDVKRKMKEDKQEEDDDLKRLSMIKKFREFEISSVEDYKNVEKCEFDGLVFNKLHEIYRHLGNKLDYENAVDENKNVNIYDLEEVPIEVDDGSKCKQVDLNEVSLIKEETPISVNQAPIFEEPDVGSGVTAALKLAKSKGYLDKEASPQIINSRLKHLKAQNYSIDAKSYGSEKAERGNRRDYPVQEFKEKESFKPNVKLEYLDDQGNVLDSKEAFRYMSHRFHGVGPGKNKIKKRLKKSQQERLFKNMDSTDTPLGTLSLLRAKQKETQSLYIVLSGKTLTISKN